ncbi:uncharacterized protein SPAPADRAFT_51842 [Spathaspora passalidarum NRRL Y-27907]|uniref:Nucleoporin Nup159/Nup146 N-terminal domain-containing protein n=1 Tax=Spathaspora passalidarum (strain NRRL Y-27907 / 11-Y1) TaxID=619300 RepID=G3AS26_SPAPN|nr:uncharacterized protein SPAPADRAFT_51842 [Spathaspora passalidarum NRRL Y-27907]EGW31875.1 hypothetical protein SPAPADRAFT_51842 [Spathaspora passalidarum NRRL Y-27907]
MLVEEIISQDLGFKLDTPEHEIPLFDTPIDLSAHGSQDLNLLAVNNDLRLLAVSNISQLKLVSLDKLDKSTSIGDALSITQVHFNSSRLLVVNTSRIQTLSVSSYQIGDVAHLEYYPHLNKDIKSILPSPYTDSFLSLTVDNELYLCDDKSSTLIASNVSSYCWKQDGSYIYALNNDTTTLAGKSIEFDDPPSEDSHIVSMFPFNQYLLVTYDITSDDFEHDIKSYVFEDKPDYYIPMDVDTAPPFGMVERTATYYTSTINEWVESYSYSFITSSLATELSILSLSGHTLELIGYSEDIYRAQFPMNEETDDDCSPVGIGISLELSKEVAEPCPGVDSVTGKLPKVYILLDTGKLISYWVFHKHGLINDEVSLQRVIDYEKKLKSNAKPVASAPSIKPVSNEPSKGNEATTVQPENPFGSAENPFGSSGANPFGSSSANAFKPSTTSPATGFGGFGQKSDNFGSTGFGQAKPEGFGAAATSGAFGGSNFGKSLTGGAFGNQTKTSDTASPFGNQTTTIPGKQNTTNPLSGPTTFGSTSFGQPSSFTTHGFDNMTKTPQAAKNTAHSNFAKFSSSAASFGSGKTDIFSQSTDSPFGKLNEKPASSPFGKLNEQAGNSPFGKLNEQSTNSPFGKLNEQPANSPFAKLTKEEGPSDIFAQKDAPKEDAKKSAFGNFSGSKSIFEQPSQEDKPIESKPKSVFNPVSFAPETKKDQPTFESSEKLSSPGFSNFGKLSLASEEVKSLASPFAKLTQNAPVETQSEDVSDFSEETEEEEEISEEGESEELSEEGESEEIGQSIDLISQMKLKSESVIELPKKQPTIPSKSKLALSNDVLSTSEEEAETPEEINAPVEPIEFLVFDGLTRPTPKQGNVIGDEISRLVNITQGNLSVLKANIQLLGQFIQDHDSPTSADLSDVQRISQRDLLTPTIEKLVDPLHVLKSDLSKQLGQVDELSTQVQKCLYEKVKLDKLYSRLALLDTDNTKSHALKHRPLDIQNELMQMNLREKLAHVKTLESKLYSLIMPIKAVNSLNSETLNNIEQVVFQINSQIQNQRESIDKLEEEIKKLEVDDNKVELPQLTSSPRLKLVQRLRRTQPSSTAVKFMNQ